MKFNSTFLICLLAGTMLAFSSCKKEEVEPVTPPTPTNPTPTITTPFTAKIDGVEFVEETLETDVSAWSSTLEIQASKNSGSEFVRIKVPDNIGAGTYTFQDPDLGVFSAYYDDGNSIYGAANGTGSLVIVSNTAPAIGTPGEIKGTFSFTASPYSFSSGTDSYSVTEGQFFVEYQ